MFCGIDSISGDIPKHFPHSDWNCFAINRGEILLVHTMFNHARSRFANAKRAILSEMECLGGVKTIHMSRRSHPHPRSKCPLIAKTQATNCPRTTWTNIITWLWSIKQHLQTSASSTTIVSSPIVSCCAQFLKCCMSSSWLQVISQNLNTECCGMCSVSPVFTTCLKLGKPLRMPSNQAGSNPFPQGAAHQVESSPHRRSSAEQPPRCGLQIGHLGY